MGAGRIRLAQSYDIQAYACKRHLSFGMQRYDIFPKRQNKSVFSHPGQLLAGIMPSVEFYLIDGMFQGVGAFDDREKLTVAYGVKG